MTFSKEFTAIRLKFDNGIIQGLEKEIMMLGDKVIRMTKEKPYQNISRDVIAIGHDLFDLGLLNAANLAIILDTVENPADPKVKEMGDARRKEGRKTRIIYHLYELPERWTRWNT
ncbi:MAG: hypothetical protein ABIF85_02505 [Nanoarchaeota archaeon]|nr:hypothetical protein [Nanoarchaeota archaeon]MBU4299996.1 hypothetical protein [Nanoarchaeota archaeon]MBU4452002.1 hypothetical protein [Nanoarchaeota archaeon]MCG2724090.1 hypothetical protein [archaeon]